MKSTPDVEQLMPSPRKSNQPVRVALYARVSTTGQTTDNQLVELRDVAQRMNWVIVDEFVDHGISGNKGRKDRPQLDALLKGVARRQFDMVAAWSVDRLGRSLSDLISLLQEMHAVGIDLYLHQQDLNTTTPAGKALFAMMGVFAEFEHGIIRERVLAGLTRAKERGTRSGLPIGRPRVTEAVEAEIKALRSTGMGVCKIARTAGCGVSTVQRVIAATGAAA